MKFETYDKLNKWVRAHELANRYLSFEWFGDTHTIYYMDDISAMVEGDLSSLSPATGEPDATSVRFLNEDTDFSGPVVLNTIEFTVKTVNYHGITTV